MENESTNKLLKVIIALMLRGLGDGGLTLRDQIKLLSDLSLRPSEIAAILGRTDSYVNKELSGIRKSSKNA